MISVYIHRRLLSLHPLRQVPVDCRCSKCVRARERGRGGGGWERKKARLRDTYTPPLQPVTRNISDISQDGFINESILYCPLVRIKSTHHRYQLLQTHPIVGLTHPKKWVKPTLKSGSNPSNPPYCERHKEGEPKQDARGREGERGTCTEERGTECVRETYTEEESDKETTQKQKATQKQKEEDEEAWVGGGVH